MGKFTNFILITFMVLLFEGCVNAAYNSKANGGRGKQADIKVSLRQIHQKMHRAMQMRSDDSKNTGEPTLVAVSTAQPVELILQAYAAGQRHFGENYVSELISKATDRRIMKSCREIKWHFIGRLTSNRVADILSVPNLYVIETINTKEIATALEKAIVESGNKKKQIRVFVQPRTSIPDVSNFVKHVIDCPHLKFSGLMIPGKNEYDPSKGPNPEFFKMVEYRKQLHDVLNLSAADVQLSMGMSKDFEQAIALGSDNVRIGTAIFGEREPQKEGRKSVDSKLQSRKSIKV